jgi:hypothetical protein
MSAPPTYEKATFNFQNRQSINKQIFQTIIEKLNEIENIEESGIDEIHSSFIRQIVKAFDKDYLYDGFDKDYTVVLRKLSSRITQNNNFALRNINEIFEVIH